jgi:hypothetical protein
MIATACRSGRGYVFGLRILGKARWLYFRREWTQVELIFPDDPAPKLVTITDSFWERTPVLRGSCIRRFYERNGLVPWKKDRPPHFDLEPLGEGRFRLNWLEHVQRQPALRLAFTPEGDSDDDATSREEVS